MWRLKDLNHNIWDNQRQFLHRKTFRDFNDYAKKSDLTLRADLIWCVPDYIVRGFHIISGLDIFPFFQFTCKMNVRNVFHQYPIFIGWYLLRQKMLLLKSNIFSSAKWLKTKLTHEPLGIVDSMEMKYECELTKVGKVVPSLCLVCRGQEKGGDTAPLLLLHHGFHQAPLQYLLFLLQHHLVLHHHCICKKG